MKSQKDAERGSILSIERIVGLLAKRIADRVVDSLAKAGFDKHFAASLLKALKTEAKGVQDK